MENKVYSIENQDGLNFSVQRHHRAPLRTRERRSYPKRLLFFLKELILNLI